MEHESIANMLNNYGIEKIIFIPMHVNYDYKTRAKMRLIYKSICGLDFCNKTINKYNIFKNLNGKYKIIEFGKEFVSLWFPANLIMTGSKDRAAQRYKESNREINGFFDKPITECKPYLDLYRWIKDKNIDLSDYLFVTNREEEKDEWLSSRIELYNVYEDALEFDLSFFSESPCECIVKNNTVYIYDGMTRTHFLISKGFELVPIRLSIDDYRKLN